MSIWPENLIEELAFRRCIIFFGSGVSATAKDEQGNSPKTWRIFIESLLSISNANDDERAFIESMLSQNNYLLALQTVYDTCDSGRYNDFLKKEFLRSNYQASETHRAIKELDSKVVITTNFDKIYETICTRPSYVTLDYTETSSIVSNLKSPEYLIIKAHGCISKDSEKLIFTSKQYFEAQKKYIEFYKILEALFLTHTVLFLGYSLNDPDINLILQIIQTTSSVASPHYILSKSGTQKQIIKHWKETYNVSLLEYEGDYSQFSVEVQKLKDMVLAFRQDREMA